MSAKDREAKVKPLALPGYVFEKDPALILEEVLTPEGPAFCRYWVGDDKWDIHQGVFDLGVDPPIVPLEDDLLAKGAVLLPGEPLEYGTEGELLAGLVAWAGRWVDVDPALLKLALAVTLTGWLWELCPVLPIINPRGPSETGKTRLGTTLWQLSYRGMKGDGALTLASLFRAADRWRGTLYVNEADLPRYRRAEDSETSALIKFYNARYEKKGFIWRVNKRTMELEAFPVFGPTILVTRRGFSDDALESRCLVILMQTTAREDIPLNLPPAFYEEAAVWRRKLLLFRLRHRLSFENDYEARIPGLQPRMQQILQPVVSLAKMISPSLVREIEGLAVDLNERVVEDRATSYEGQLVRAFARLKAARPGNVWRLPPEEVEAGQCRRCGKVRDLPWRDLNAVLFCDNCRADLEEGELVTATIIADVLNVGRKENRQVTPQAVGVRAKGLGLESRMKPDRSQRYLDAEPELLRHLLQKYAPREEREDLLAALGLADRSGQQSISQVVGPEPAPKEGQESETKTSMEAPSRAGS
ncbi:MAG: hypothetical protein V3U45_01155 [bacterium]